MLQIVGSYLHYTCTCFTPKAQNGFDILPIDVENTFYFQKASSSKWQLWNTWLLYL